MSQKLIHAVKALEKRVEDLQAQILAEQKTFNTITGKFNERIKKLETSLRDRNKPSQVRKTIKDGNKKPKSTVKDKV